MQLHYTTPNGKNLVATVSGSTLTMYVPRHPTIVMLKIPQRLKSALGYAIKRPCFTDFAAVVDEIEAKQPKKKRARKRNPKASKKALEAA